MLKNILKLEGTHALNKNEQRSISGGSGVYANEAACIQAGGTWNCVNHGTGPRGSGQTCYCFIEDDGPVGPGNDGVPK